MSIMNHAEELDTQYRSISIRYWGDALHTGRAFFHNDVLLNPIAFFNCIMFWITFRNITSSSSGIFAIVFVALRIAADSA